MSGGPGPNGFKGFENGNPLPTCGGTWTSQPGNSSNPPPTVPQFMAVIVSSSVQKNGSVINGDIQKIVIVRTNPGYEPAPGHVGTGTVVAILCGPTNQSASFMYRILNLPQPLKSPTGLQWLSASGIGVFGFSPHTVPVTGRQFVTAVGQQIDWREVYFPINKTIHERTQNNTNESRFVPLGVTRGSLVVLQEPG